jgi:hypothetical protein
MALQLSKNELKIRNYIKQSFKTIVESATLKIGGCNIQRINIIKLTNNHCRLRREIEVFAL